VSACTVSASTLRPALSSPRSRRWLPIRPAE
jgi:hypothetical protein